MIISNRFVFVHLPRTGGTFIRQVLLKHAPHDWQVTNVTPDHPTIKDIPPEYKGLPVFGFVRNPWDWYVSWYEYLKRRGDNELFNQISGHGRNGFKQTLLAGFEKDFLKKQDIGGISWYLSECFGPDLDALKIGKFERLREELLAILNSVCDAPESLRNAVQHYPAANTSIRRKYQDYYDEELRELVAYKDRNVIRRFGYSFSPVPTEVPLTLPANKPFRKHQAKTEIGNQDDSHGIAFAGGFRIRPYQAKDEHHILPLFSRVFPRARSLEEWHWIYRQSPNGSRIMLAWSPNGELAAHYAGVVHRAVLNGQEVLVGNIRDIFTAPSCRTVREGRQVLVAGTAETFFARWTGSEKIVFCYGFPHQRHFRLGQLSMKYRPFSRWANYHYRIAENVSAFSHLPATGTMCAVDSFGSEFDRLWEKHKSKFQFAVCRTSAFLTWRFLRNPSRSYRIWRYSPFLSNETEGYAVFLADRGQAWLLDFCFPEPLQAARWFWQEITIALRWQGTTRINTWLALAGPDARLLTCLGFQQINIKEQMTPVFRTFVPELMPEWCDAQFRFTMADSDLF
ncbi:MAG: GNAT family N-acetyltransferase [Gammaproteobacteria bacterium]|nr:GNAT family N-acetyltransferase [Gammaproteobacteria bacterium]